MLARTAVILVVAIWLVQLKSKAAKLSKKLPVMAIKKPPILNDREAVVDSLGRRMVVI